jgi:hypothetical protein
MAYCALNLKFICQQGKPKQKIEKMKKQQELVRSAMESVEMKPLLLDRRQALRG